MEDAVGEPVEGVTITGASAAGTQTFHSVETRSLDGQRAVVVDSSTTATEAVPCELKGQTIFAMSPNWSAAPQTKNVVALTIANCREDADKFADELGEIVASFGIVGGDRR